MYQQKRKGYASMSFLKGLKDVAMQGIDRALTAAEDRTPNLDDFAPREYVEYEVHPKTLNMGDEVVVVEYNRDHKTIHDISKNPAFVGTVYSVDKRNELVVFMPDMNTYSFFEARFFLQDELRQENHQPSPTQKVRREDMEDGVIYDGEIVD